jgi:hypothetical protein
MAKTARGAVRIMRAMHVLFPVLIRALIFGIAIVALSYKAYDLANVTIRHMSSY